MSLDLYEEKLLSVAVSAGYLRRSMSDICSGAHISEKHIVSLSSRVYVMQVALVGSILKSFLLSP